MKNPLDQFQSHSIHYVMLAARSTEDVRSFTDDAQSQSLSAIDGARQLGDEIRIGNSTSYLVIDTRRFSQYLITDFELETMMAGFSVPGSKSPNSTAINMKFTVVDSNGIAFANFLQYLMDQKLQVSYDGMTLLIRLLFIGHRADGTTAVVQSVTIPAMFKQIQLDLNDIKGLYSCTLLPMIGMTSNGSQNAKWTSIGTASSYFSGFSANNLGAVVNSFERRLNEESLKRFSQLNAQTQTNGVKQTVGTYGRPVQYMITLPKGWDVFTFSGPTQGAAVETSFKELLKAEEATRSATTAEAQKKSQQNATAPAKDSFVAVSPGLSVTEVLDVIFSQCTEVAKLGNFTKKQDQDGNLRFYKHLITVTSDNDSFTVHVDIVEFIVPNVDLATGDKSRSVGVDDQQLYIDERREDGSLIRRPRLYVEYDYIFSGKNIDVLSLDLKIEHLNYLLMQGAKLGQGEVFSLVTEGQKQTDGDSISTEEHPVFGRRKKDPALIPVRSRAESTNHANIGANAKIEGDDTPQAVNQQYIQNLQAFYSGGPVEAKLQLRGNPDLLVSVSLQAIPEHVSAITITGAGGELSATNESVKSKYRADFEKNLLKLNGGDAANAGSPVNSQMLTGRNYVSSPFFMKVNVFGPNANFLTGAANPGDFAQKLFYENYYFVDTVVSKIDSGAKFTQDVSLRSFSVFNFPTVVAQGANTSTTSVIDRPTRGGQ
jgi:hypothetical protein